MGIDTSALRQLATPIEASVIGGGCDGRGARGGYLRARTLPRDGKPRWEGQQNWESELDGVRARFESDAIVQTIGDQDLRSPPHTVVESELIGDQGSLERSSVAQAVGDQDLRSPPIIEGKPIRDGQRLLSAWSEYFASGSVPVPSAKCRVLLDV